MQHARYFHHAHSGGGGLANGQPEEDPGLRYAHIPGWGIDADPENDPTYPVKRWNGADHLGLNYTRPPLQPESVEKLRSNERPSLSAVFGTSSPPSGLSGRLRRYAFRFSEGNWNHWLLLLLADRINMYEGLADDLRKGQCPDIIRERGWTAEWKYNREGLIRNISIAAAVAAGLLVIWAGGRRLARDK